MEDRLCGHSAFPYNCRSVKANPVAEVCPLQTFDRSKQSTFERPECVDSHRSPQERTSALNSEKSYVSLLLT